MVAKSSKVDRENARQRRDAIKVATFACRRGLWLKRKAATPGTVVDSVLDFLGVHQVHRAFWMRMAELIGDPGTLDVDPELLAEVKDEVVSAVWAYEADFGELIGWDECDPAFKHGGVL